MAVPGGTSAAHRKAAPADLTPELVRTPGDRAPPFPGTPEYLANHLPAEIERWAKPIHAAGISAD
jgi:hypothetical protein